MTEVTSFKLTNIRKERIPKMRKGCSRRLCDVINDSELENQSETNASFDMLSITIP